MAQMTEEMSAGPARVRVDMIGEDLPDHVLEDMNFLNYRLAAVQLETTLTLDRPDIVWDRSASTMSVAWDGSTMHFDGEWAAGPIQKAIVTVLALRLEEQGLHPFHASAVRYQGKSV